MVLNYVVSQFQCFNHFSFAAFAHFTFHHIQVVHGSGNNNIEGSFFHLFKGRVNDKFAIYFGYTHFRYRSVERNIGNCDSGRSS